jgi:hypothetical protein
MMRIRNGCSTEVVLDDHCSGIGGNSFEHGDGEAVGRAVPKGESRTTGVDKSSWRLDKDGSRRLYAQSARDDFEITACRR